MFLGFLFGESPLVGSKVINLFSNMGCKIGSNLETVAIELLSKLCVITYGLCFCIATMGYYHSSLPGVILGLPLVANPIPDVCATASRWQVVHDPFSMFASRTTLFPRGETAVVNTTSQTLFTL